jgi:hypothetical protein
MTHYDTEIIAYNSVIIVTRFADAGAADLPGCLSTSTEVPARLVTKSPSVLENFKLASPLVLDILERFGLGPADSEFKFKFLQQLEKSCNFNFNGPSPPRGEPSKIKLVTKEIKSTA